MIEHNEFPWGPEHVPGLLTPLGAFGWVVAAVLALVLLGLLRRGETGKGPKSSESRLEDVYRHVLAAARYAVRQDEYGIMHGADTIRRTVKDQLGGLLMAGGALQKHLKTLGETLGEGDDKKADRKKKKKDDHGHGPAHGHGNGGHGHAAPVAAEPVASTTVAETVHGHSITLNIGTDVAERPVVQPPHKPDHDHGHDHDEDEAPPTLEQQLQAVRKAVREFEAWWSDKPARLAELRAARDGLIHEKPLDPVVASRIHDHEPGPRRNPH